MIETTNNWCAPRADAARDRPGRTPEGLADKLAMAEQVRKVLRSPKRPISLETPIATRGRHS